MVITDLNIIVRLLKNQLRINFDVRFLGLKMLEYWIISSNQLRSFSCTNQRDETHTYNNQILNVVIFLSFLFHIFHGIVTYLVKKIPTLKTGSPVSRAALVNVDKLLPNFTLIYVEKLVYCTSHVYLFTLSLIYLLISQWL